MTITDDKDRGASTTPKVFQLPALAVLALCLACIVGCQSAQPATSATIDTVFFAQKHVLKPTAPTFALIGGLEALVKVQVYSKENVQSPAAVAILELNGDSKELQLNGPSVLPKPPEGERALMKQSFDDSFTGYVPKDWVKPGLKMTVELRHAVLGKAMVFDRKTFATLPVTAPNKMILTMLTVHYFGQGKGEDYPRGWLKELEAKLPVSEIELRRAPPVSFDSLVMPPRGGKPSVFCVSENDYEKQTGLKYDGEQNIALRWNNALKRAAGIHSGYSHYFLNISGVHSGGQARGFFGVGNLARPGVLIHELGHTFGLPHWTGRTEYPYKGHMFGVRTERDDFPHVGPNWAFDVNKNAFIPAIVQKDSERGKKGQWKKDPMAGGGWGDQEDAYTFRHFSDYSMMRMRTFMQNRAVVWNDGLKGYASWDSETRSYSKPAPVRNGVMPVERDVDVISLLVTASKVTPKASIVYPPIGPYKTALIERYDASSMDAIQKAKNRGYSEKSCNVCLRVTQGGTVKTYLMPLKISATDDPLRAFHVAAINLPARDGAVTKAELLHVPKVMAQGLKGQIEPLFVWNKGE